MAQLKLALIGDSATGKTQLLASFSGSDGNWQESEFGHNILSKDIKINDTRITLVIWDLPGQNRFKTLRSTFYKGSDIIGIVFDLTRRSTFTTIHKWVREVAESLKFIPPIVLIGTKKDLTEYHEVHEDEINQISKRFQLTYYLVDATKPKEVEHLLLNVISNLINVEAEKKGKE